MGSVKLIALGMLVLVSTLNACGGSSTPEQDLPPPADDQAVAGTPANGRWGVDPEHPPSPDAKTISVLVSSRDCNSGAPVERKRIKPPSVEYGDEAITVSYVVESSDEPETCPTHPPTALELQLSEPLGERVLLDGGREPGKQQVWPE